MPREVAFEAAKLFRRDDDHFVTPMDRHALGSFTVDAPHELAEAGLGILQDPVPPTLALTHPAFGLWFFSRLWFCNSSHDD